ncbi:MAG: helix-turn-helix domain-containing protein [Gammaproteobacteria bacterium]|nr:helix-turn-helix domain-containing protein [Gammaproteobacteria bacterium]
METLDLKEAALFLKINHEVLRRRVKAQELLGAKVGKSWVFLKDDLINYIRSKQVPRCRSTSAEIHGGCDLPPQAEKEYLALQQN